VVIDTIVVGAGIVGVLTTWELTQRGARVCLLDAGEVSSGTTGLGEGNVLCSDKDAGPELDLSVLALAVYDDVERWLGEEARIRRKGALIVHPDERTWAAEPARAERLRAAGVAAELLSPAEVLAREPRLTGAVHGALHVPGDLQCDPRRITRALAARAAAAGADVRVHTRVASLLVEAGGVVGVRLDGGEELRAPAVVVAAGPWSRELVEGAGLPFPLEPRKGQLVQLGLPAPDEQFLRHKVVDGSYLLSVTSTATGRELSTVVETTWDGAVVLGSSRERSGFDASVDPAVVSAMVERGARLVPELAGLEVETTWVGFRPWLPDHLPAIGPSRRLPGLWLGTGHEGAGVALGPVTGRALAAAIQGEAPPMDLAAFDPDRFA
jgi:glycine/D-amino acid oxidase-like deaminating enzyme